jgi:fused signal recognition particle receptor
LATDRRTRDRVRLFFWAVLTVVCLVAVLVARQQQTQGLQRKADAAQERAVRFTENVLADQLDARRVARPIERSGYDALLADLKHGLFNDQRVVRARVWRADGLLVFTTDHPSEIGVTTSDDPNLRSAFRGDLVSVVVNESFAADDTTTSKPTALFSTFIPLRTTDKAEVFGVVQIDNDYGIMVDASSHPWKQMQVAFAIVALLCLVMAIVSFVWSHRKEEVAGFGPSRRDVRAGARDEKKAGAAQAEAAKLRERVKELEGKSKSIAEQQVELEKLRGRVAEFEQRPARVETGDPVQMTQLKAHATQLEEQARGAESRVAQLQSRVTEMEAQLRVTTEQLRVAQKRADEAPAPPEGVPAPIQAQLAAAAETEELLRAELEASRAETQRLELERDAIERAHSEEAQSQLGQLDQVRAQARLAEEERQRILAEAAKGSTAQSAISANAEEHMKDLTQQLERSEAERAMLRAGRPETVYEARNRQLEDDLAQVREQLAVAEGRARSGDASKAGVDPSVIAALEERIAAAEERAHDAERRLDEAKPRRTRARTAQRSNGNGSADGDSNGNADAAADAAGDVAPADLEAETEPDGAALEKAKVDGSELRSRLVRSTDARRRGISTPTATPAPGPKRR